MMNNYAQTLRTHNLKATPQRIAITDTIYKYGHITIDALYEVMQKQFNSLSLATIYKNINTMIKSRLIQEVKIPNKKSVFELTKETHSHLVCKKCGAVSDITLDLSGVVASASKASGFAIDQEDFILSGTCPNCK